MERIAANTVGASIADAIVGAMLTEENLTRALNSGTIKFGQPGTANMHRLTEIDTSRVFALLNRLSPIEPVEFAFRLGETDDAGV